MSHEEGSIYHELLLTNFDPAPMLDRQLSLLGLSAQAPGGSPELRILAAPRKRLPKVWDWPQD